jgi:hypothetical protein
VNAGKRRVVVTALDAPPVARLVDVAGEELVTVALQVQLPATPRPSAPRSTGDPRPFLQERARSPRPATRTWPLALCWTTTGLLAAGTAVAGVVALGAARDLQQHRDAFPASPEELADARHKARVAAFATDGLLTATALMTAVSLYVTLSGPGDTSVAVGPGSLRWSGRF